MSWETSDMLSLTALIISGTFAILTIILNRREKPSIMPYGYNLSGNKLKLNFKNTGNINLNNLSILINKFDSDLNEINNMHKDKFMFSIAANSDFNYNFRINPSKKIFFRIRFKGRYNLKFPFFSKSYKQIIWYSCVPEKINEKLININIFTTHRKEFKKIQAKHKTVLHGYEENFDKELESWISF